MAQSQREEAGHDHEYHRRSSRRVRGALSGDHRNFALFLCFVNGEPAAAIVAVHQDGGNYAITPLFVSVTPSLILTDHDGQPASDARP
jgi:hypothetical protein